MSFSGVDALYLFLLAGVAGYSLARRVPTMLQTPLLAASNFMHGVVLLGAILALGTAASNLQLAIGFVGVAAGTANVVGGFVVSDRMLRVIETKARASVRRRRRRQAAIDDKTVTVNRSSELKTKRTQSRKGRSSGEADQ